MNRKVSSAPLCDGPGSIHGGPMFTCCAPSDYVCVCNVCGATNGLRWRTCKPHLDSMTKAHKRVVLDSNGQPVAPNWQPIAILLRDKP